MPNKINADLPALQALIIYMMGVVDAHHVEGDSFYPEFSVPLLLKNQAVNLLHSAALHDEQTREGATLPSDPLGRGGKWHRAANVLNAWVRRESKAMEARANYAYPSELPTGDWSFAGFMDLARHQIEHDGDWDKAAWWERLQK